MSTMTTKIRYLCTNINYAGKPRHNLSCVIEVHSRLALHQSQRMIGFFYDFY